MPLHTQASHTFHLPAPIEQCLRFFTPAGEELWVDGWSPTYLHPRDGRTEQGMVFTTGSGEDFTIWTLVDFEVAPHYARYTRVTPATRTGIVEVVCTPRGEEETSVEVTYTMTALTPAGAEALDAYTGDALKAMIEGWKTAIETRLPMLVDAQIR